MTPKSSIRVDRGFVQEHDRNVVLDRIHAPATRALERFSLRHYRNLAFRTDQNIEQFFVDHVGILHPASLPSERKRESRLLTYFVEQGPAFLIAGNRSDLTHRCLTTQHMSHTFEIRFAVIHRKGNVSHHTRREPHRRRN